MRIATSLLTIVLALPLSGCGVGTSTESALLESATTSESGVGSPGSQSDSELFYYGLDKNHVLELLSSDCQDYLTVFDGIDLEKLANNVEEWSRVTSRADALARVANDTPIFNLDAFSFQDAIDSKVQQSLIRIADNEASVTSKPTPQELETEASFWVIYTRDELASSCYSSQLKIVSEAEDAYFALLELATTFQYPSDYNILDSIGWKSTTNGRCQEFIHCGAVEVLAAETCSGKGVELIVENERNGVVVATSWTTFTIKGDADPFRVEIPSPELDDVMHLVSAKCIERTGKYRFNGESGIQLAQTFYMLDKGIRSPELQVEWFSCEGIGYGDTAARLHLTTTGKKLVTAYVNVVWLNRVGDIIGSAVARGVVSPGLTTNLDISNPPGLGAYSDCKIAELSIVD